MYIMKQVSDIFQDIHFLFFLDYSKKIAMKNNVSHISY